MSKMTFVATGMFFWFTLWIVPSTEAAILNVSGQASAQVNQIVGGSVVQTQSVTNSFPPPTTIPPAISNVQIDGLSFDGVVTSSGQCTSVADDSRTSQPVLPFANNDLGLDLGGFSTDGQTSYLVNGSAHQTRLISLSRSETTFPTIGDGRFRSTLSVAGALIVVATSPTPDLTGLELSVHFEVVQKRPNDDATTLLTGAGTLTGGPNGQLTFTGDGVVNAFFYPIINILAIVPSLQDQPFGFLKAVAFPANIFNYEYSAAPDEEFELTASFTAQAKIPPNEVGAAAVFGLPQEVLGEVMARVRNDDSGVKAQEAIATIVDTSGRTGVGAGLPFFALCGVLGAESLALTVGVAMVGLWRRRTRSIRRRA